MGADAKRKESRKRKFGAQMTELQSDSTMGLGSEKVEIEEPAKKKIKRVSQSLLDVNIDPAAEGDEGDEAGEIQIVSDSAEQDGEQAVVTQKTQRFIVFIGNLPYTATDDSIKSHFAKVHPKSIRHRTEKASGKSKGFAFLEFEGYDHMKTCLKLFHHVDFDDGVSPERKLNVELTVGGGGGKSKDRKSKLRTKNERLNEQRKRRLEEEAKQTKKSKKGAELKHPSPPEDPVNNDDIHPSRRSRVAVE